MSSESGQNPAVCWICGGATKVDPKYASTTLVRCVDCGFLFDPGRDAEDLRELYGNEYFENYPGGSNYLDDQEQRRVEARKRLEWMKPFKPSGNIFEIGATAGFFLDEARIAGYSVAGVEPAPDVSSYAREEFGLDVQTGFVEDVDLPVGAYDAVCAFHVLEHIHKPLPSLKHVRSSLADDGYLFLEIPNIESALARHDGTKWFHLDQPNHVAFYTPENLGNLLEQAGFELVETDTVSEYHFFRPLLKFRPISIAGRSLKRIRSKTPQGRPHPTNHPLMRVVARVSG